MAQPIGPRCVNQGLCNLCDVDLSLLESWAYNRGMRRGDSALELLSGGCCLEKPEIRQCPVLHVCTKVERLDQLSIDLSTVSARVF